MTQRAIWAGLGRGMALAGGLLLAGCATGAPSPEALAAHDPFEASNRQTLVFNGKLDRYVVVPSFAVYFVLVPEPGRKAVHNFLNHLTLPTTFVNDLLQGEVTRGAQTAGRFLVNSTFGLGGFFDVASRMRIPNHGEDFGQTLAVWGVGENPYLMLPFFGPSNPRDAFGMAADIGLDPTVYIHFKQHIWWDAGRMYLTVLDLKGQTYQQVKGIQRSSVDYYASLRSLYRQMRAAEIRNGRPETADLPDF